jgi:poly(3-hydroxybutyrate) depolymerase
MIRMIEKPMTEILPDIFAAINRPMARFLQPVKSATIWLSCLLIVPAAGSAGALPPLPALNIEIGETSVSGLSSGGFMAVQFQVAHSSIVKGAGIIAAGPYFCARNDVVTATTKCSCTLDPLHQLCAVTPTSADVPSLVKLIGRMARDKLIDDPKNIARQRVFTFSGGKDQIVPSPVVAQLNALFSSLGVPSQNLSAASLADAGHGMPTETYGQDCAVTGEPYLNKCHYDAAGKILNWIYGPLKPARSGAPQGHFIAFDQKPYLPKRFAFQWGSGLDSSGWLYVPAACASGAKCRLHIALHGCKQGQSYALLQPPDNGGTTFATSFVSHAGYDAWADSNDLVVLFPQAVSIPFTNPNGCWDWWGYTDAHYADQRGVQISALRAMVDRLAAGAH